MKFIKASDECRVRNSGGECRARKWKVARVEIANASGECRVRVGEFRVASSKGRMVNVELKKAIGDLEKASVELEKVCGYC